MKKIIIKLLTVALEKVADADVMLFEKATDEIREEIIVDRENIHDMMNF